ncbi:MAG: DEAD/SNF2-like helicase [Edafosvirus sp.]|uniref:DEAD/SNF2-like helicase n=1 Tax=Edafosvirus sp. TaxID=2487765 RepID=A0A3G4ZTX5_9VIRU|nr:MAG: DEAD/SNF2-like helicase [Edafosvirus sp.]
MELNKEIKDKLLSYQVNHTTKLINIIKKNTTALDASDTGTGKTYSAIALCKQLDLHPIIICPKSVLFTWRKVCEFFNVQPFFIVNYETIRMGKYYLDYKRGKCPYIKLIMKDDLQTFEWKLPDNSKKKLIFIFDEVHKCSEVSTNNGQLLFAAKQSELPMLILSATIADSPLKFKLFTYVLNFIDPSNVKEDNIDFEKYMRIVNSWLFKHSKIMQRIHAMLYYERASRMRLDDIKDVFPSTQISAIPYNLGKERETEIENQYKIIADSLDDLKDKSKRDKSNPLVRMLRAHQKIELIKVPLFVELANDFMHNGYSVVIFVNFTQTLKLLQKMLLVKCVIHGGQTEQQRSKMIQDFQDNNFNILVANIKSGSSGISLHDLHGGHPRASILSPTWNSVDLIQALGRVHRANGKTVSIQRIVYIANTVEERIADKVREKIKNTDAINDGDLDLKKIIYEKKK